MDLLGEEVIGRRHSETKGALRSTKEKTHAKRIFEDLLKYDQLLRKLFEAHLPLIKLLLLRVLTIALTWDNQGAISSN